ncbi:D-alanyl-D-alanine carboxypeptidase family protein [Pseudoxanthomonas winnipegensis]|uniref:M15 family metallopeptidase n=1 Tax=Pseudoxanthomonas winnipegensis TaxID=2480810 RepID=UPI0025767444|nr:M15 family metallopeptidase [Pseudoxanthomonas winnipegensis]WJI14615.1 D-alanyl-D-alanine carboxypeptidase family protein [Pseudoxanthomonas winnipegensis]
MSAHPLPQTGLLLNTAEVELWPAPLLRARANADARVLARASRVLRRKDDGRYLAAVVPEGLVGLLPGWSRTPGIDEALDRLEAIEHARPLPGAGEADLPLTGLRRRLDRLGLDADDYAARTGLALIAEPATLWLAGRDRYDRPLWLTRAASRAWRAMQAAAWEDQVRLDAISGYRSHAYQLGIFERKRARGQTVEQILTVNAAPGYSEHHAGTALDIGTPGEAPAEESFERTPAFAWLGAHAGRFGFAMSYPRDNPHGIVYEPWHWRHQG